MGYPRIDAVLASEARVALGVQPGTPVDDVVRAFRSQVATGSVAKLAAVAAGRRPPGEDPTTLWEAVLAGVVTSWACWPLVTALGGLLADDGHDVGITVEQRRGPSAPVVDFHAVLVVDGAVVDPWMGPGSGVLLDTAASDGLTWATWVGGDHGRHDHLGVVAGGGLWWYRQVAHRIDAMAVRAFCELSATHTGMGQNRTATLTRADVHHRIRDADPATGQPARHLVSSAGDPFAMSRAVVATGDFDDLLADVLTGP